MSRYHAKIYRDCPHCGERYAAVRRTADGHHEYPCGCPAAVVPTAAELEATA